MAQVKENSVVLNKHILLCIDCIDMNRMEEIIKQFCGIVYLDIKLFDGHIIQPNTNIYICGDILKIYQTSINIINRPTQIITEVSHNHEKIQIKTEIPIGRIPLNMYNAGIYFKQFFNSDKDYFSHITKEHEFQALTESNKPDTALRKGIYLSKVVEEHDGLLGGYRFNLLRCSTNLNGPTENFRDTDNEIIDDVNNVIKDYFAEPVELNHVLAQVYENTKCGGANKDKERKAKISAHSDKTKDMPRNGLIAFCTFYKDYKINGGGQGLYKGESIFTKLRFKLKADIKDMCPSFEIILYPNSVFIIPLSINRLYLHEISPSILPVDMIPVRCGYVIRCSDVEAVYKTYDCTYIDDIDYDFVRMDEEPTEEDIKHLKDLYFKENSTINIINYGKIYFSLNKGDYMQPKI